MISLVIFGSRDVYPTNEYITYNLGIHVGLHPRQIDQLICGMANGADAGGRRWAKHFKHIEIIPFRPQWDKHGGNAGMVRNAAMADVATHGLGFWNGLSRGTANMACNMIARDKPCKVIIMQDDTNVIGQVSVDVPLRLVA